MQFQIHKTDDLLAALRGHSLNSRLLSVSSELQGHTGRKAATCICALESNANTGAGAKQPLIRTP